MVQTAKVTRLLPDGRAEVSVKRQSACGHDCSKCGGGCSELMVSSTVSVIAAHGIGARPGDMVTVDADAGTVDIEGVEMRDTVSAAVMVDGKVLLLKRPDSCHSFPGMWSLVAGKIEPGETPEQAAHLRDYQGMTALAGQRKEEAVFRSAFQAGLYLGSLARPPYTRRSL